jgi:ubiquinone/menaquinone biosynthesis C-methylase UbiE
MQCLDTMLQTFVHPYTRNALKKDLEGNLLEEGNAGTVFKNYDGCYDFCVANPDIMKARIAYDDFYGRGQTSKLSISDVTSPWFDKVVPWRKTMLQSLGPLEGQKVLLLGNGESYIEFYFLLLGATVIFTDLSLVAARRAQAVFRSSELWEKYQDRMEFHSVDAMHLPFPDQAFDVVYGTKFVGFLPDREAFFAEVSRVLKPSGKCRFCDDAYSPAWEAVKRKLVHPVKTHLLRRAMSSLGKVRADSLFGFKEEALAPYLRACGFSRVVFLREYFFLRVAQLSWATLLGWSPRRERFARPLFLMMKWIDQRLARSSWVQRNRLALTWGFDK